MKAKKIMAALIIAATVLTGMFAIAQAVNGNTSDSTPVRIVEYTDVMDDKYDLTGDEIYIAHCKGIVLDKEGNGSIYGVDAEYNYINYSRLGLKPGTVVDTWFTMDQGPNYEVTARYDMVDGHLINAD